MMALSAADDRLRRFQARDAEAAACALLVLLLAHPPMAEGMAR